jgi:hypothetical protein
MSSPLLSLVHQRYSTSYIAVTGQREIEIALCTVEPVGDPSRINKKPELVIWTPKRQVLMAVLANTIRHSERQMGCKLSPKQDLTSVECADQALGRD